MRSGGDSADTTAKELAQAHLKAKFADEATMLTGLAVPFLSLESEDSATDDQAGLRHRLPRARRATRSVGSWLIMGDAKDYERVRARIDDGRMLKGFLQVALGRRVGRRLEPAARRHGGPPLRRPGRAAQRLPAPRGHVEDLADHRREVRLRAQERLDALAELGRGRSTDDELADYLAHIEATFDPRSCATCSLFAYCRSRAAQLDTSPRRC